MTALSTKKDVESAAPGFTDSERLAFPKSFALSVSAYIALILPLFFVFVRYAPLEGVAYTHHVSQYYSWFLDIEFMVFVGFGFLMTFLRRYSYSAVGLNYLLSGLIMVEALLVVGTFQQVVWGANSSKIYIDLPLMIDAAICAASGMIWFGAVIGKASPSQLLWLSVIFVPLYGVNQHLVFKTLGALDVGGSISVHAFGAYYGLAASMVVSWRQEMPGSSNPLNMPRYTSNVFAMIGTLFLWIYWPSFNGALMSVAVQSGDRVGVAPDSLDYRNQFYSIVNTVISLLGAIVSTFAVSPLIERKFNMVHVQNASLAGGVIMGSSANLYITPGGALAMGLAAGAISTLGFAYLSPLLERKIRLTDTCGVHNLHGIPGILGGLVAGFAAFGQESAMLQHGDRQLGYQILAVLITLAIAIIGGAVGGLVVTLFSPHAGTTPVLYDDDRHWMDAEAGTLLAVKYPTGAAVPPTTNLYRDSSYHDADSRSNRHKSHNGEPSEVKSEHVRDPSTRSSAVAMA